MSNGREGISGTGTTKTGGEVVASHAPRSIIYSRNEKRARRIPRFSSVRAPGWERQRKKIKGGKKEATGKTRAVWRADETRICWWFPLWISAICHSINAERLTKREKWIWQLDRFFRSLFRLCARVSYVSPFCTREVSQIAFSHLMDSNISRSWVQSGILNALMSSHLGQYSEFFCLRVF